SSLLGGILGILFLIPFRKYFVKDMHGKYPFPEATATTQVLVSGEKGGDQAIPLLMAGIIGGLYDFTVATFGGWAEVFTTRVIPAGIALADKAKVVFQMNVGAAVLGLGYIVGLKYASIIAIGSALVWFVIVPLLPFASDALATTLNPAFVGTISELRPEEIFSTFGRHIGIGGIAMAGVIGIIKSWDIIKGAVGLAAKEMGGKLPAAEAKVKRTQRDLSMKFISIAVIVTLILTFLFFYLGVLQFNLIHAVVAIIIVAVIAFLFTTVAANAIAIVGTNPVSGMTLMTLILASVILVAIGLKGPTGMVAAMIIGGVVCTALSMAGGFITDLKIGYWLGTTPKKQETWKFLGTLVSAATVGGVIMLLNKTYGFVGEGSLVAPQANAMAAVIDPLMSGTGAPWILYAAGALLAIVLTFLKVPALAFALGMFIPFELNIPLVIGGAISWFISSRSKSAALNTARHERGTLLASGLIAGGALMGVVSAAIKFIQDIPAEAAIKAAGTVTPQQITEIKNSFNWINEGWEYGNGSIWMALGMYILLCTYLVWDSMRAKVED
ncbi:MAG: oligopeptide transporter, OPT family, partial [Bacteroidales bacterium]|nr:oligopeptide transporter, OPT family [Bacteroidales bacterium]